MKDDNKQSPDQKYSPYYPKPSRVKRNKNQKTISVSNSFNRNQIPIKVIAPHRVWLNLEDGFLKNNGHIPLKSIEQYIYRTTPKIKHALKEYCNQEPEDFTWCFYHYYIFQANAVNPLFTPARKSRGGSPYLISYLKMVEIKRFSQWLYVFLSYWSKQLSTTYPEGLTKYLHNRGKLFIPNKRGNIISLTRKIINDNNFFSNKNLSDDIFYNKYIAYKDMKRIRQALSSIQYQPIRPPLLKIFPSK